MLKELQTFLKSKKDLILEANAIDIKNHNESCDFDSLIECFNFENETRMYGVKLEGFTSELTQTIKLYDNVGTVALDCQNNLLYPIFKTIAFSIFTNNSIIVNLKDGKNYITVNMVSTLINTFLQAKSIPLNVEVINKPIEEFCVLDNINKLIIISNYDYYLGCKDVYDMEIKHYSIDDPCIIVDNNAHIEYLKNIDSNILIYTTDKLKIKNNQILVNSVNEAIDLINNSRKNNKTILLTINNDTAINFVNKCKCANVLVNVVDLSKRMPNFDQKDFLYIKSYETMK